MFEQKCITGKPLYFKASEQTKSKIKGVDEQPACDMAEASSRDRELRNNPDCLWREMRFQTFDEFSNFPLRQAIKEEVGDDKIVAATSRWRVGADVSPLKSGIGNFWYSRAGQPEHSLRYINNISL